jgi:hypothetical protein
VHFTFEVRYFVSVVKWAFFCACISYNPFTAKVANKRLLGRPPSRFLAQCRTKTNTRLLIKIALFTWNVYNANERTEHSMFSKNTSKTDCNSNSFSTSKVIHCVRELLTRLWNGRNQFPRTYNFRVPYPRIIRCTFTRMTKSPLRMRGWWCGLMVVARSPNRVFIYHLASCNLWFSFLFIA